MVNRFLNSLAWGALCLLAGSGALTQRVRAVPAVVKEEKARAFNRDKPYNAFLREPLAGDEIGPDDEEKLTAAVFHRLGPVRRNAGNPEIALSCNEVLTQRTDILGAAFLGVTLGCARCHDHKFDPITQEDYYRLEAYLASTREFNHVLADPATKAAWEAKNAEIKRLRALASEVKGERRRRLKAEIRQREAAPSRSPPVIPTVRDVQESRTEMHVLKRGQWERKAKRVGMGPLDVLVSAEVQELRPDTVSPRIRLAERKTTIGLEVGVAGAQ